jgi:hypothetical protein
MSKVEQMVCPACARMHGREHDEGCPWSGLAGGVSPRPGASEAYRERRIYEVAAAEARKRGMAPPAPNAAAAFLRDVDAGLAG